MAESKLKRFRVYIDFVTTKAIEIEAEDEHGARLKLMAMDDGEIYDRSSTIDNDFTVRSLKEVW